MSNTPKEQTAGIGPEIKHRGFVKTNAKGFYNELRVFNDKDQLLTNWTGEVISAHCMYDDNDGYEEWNVTNTPDRDKANGYRVRNCYLALDGNAVPVAANLNQPPTEDKQPGETVEEAAERHCKGYPEQGKGFHLNDFVAGANWQLSQGINHAVEENESVKGGKTVSLEAVIELIDLQIQSILPNRYSDAPEALEQSLLSLKEDILNLTHPMKPITVKTIRSIQQQVKDKFIKK